MPNKPRLRPPEFALSAFYPADCVFNPRGSFQNCGRNGDRLLACDFQTGTPLPINGTLPVICSSAVCSDRTKPLFAAAGLPDFSHTILYDNESGYEALLAGCHRLKKPVIFQYPHPEQELPHELYWIDPDLFGKLNDNACLSEFVPEGYLSEHTCGGQIVAEEFLSIEDHYCVNYATDGRRTNLLGCCDQITNDAGRHAGNWISLVRHPPREAIEVGFEIMHRAASRGYIGVAGFQIVRDHNGRILVIDLDFRLNGSLPAVMWQNRLLSRKGAKCVGRVIEWRFPQSIDRDFSLLRELVESGWLFPLAIYDPQAGPYGFDEVRVRGILFGSSRYQVRQRLQKLHRKFGVSEQTGEDSSSNARAA